MYSDQQINDSYLEQAQLAQVQRWFALSGLPTVTEAGLSGLLDEGFSLRLDGRELAGSAIDYVDYLNSNSSLRIDGSYLNQIAFPNDGIVGAYVDAKCNLLDEVTGEVFAASARIEFGAEPTLLPPIERVMLSSLTTDIAGKFMPPEASRLLSVNHRWHTLVESPSKDAELFRDIVADDFAMEFGHGAVRSFAELEAWLYGSASSVKGARHDLESFEWKQADGEVSKAIFVLDWLGFNQQNERMMAKTKHTWSIVDDDPGTGFPRIKLIEVEFLKAFQLVESS